MWYGEGERIVDEADKRLLEAYFPLFRGDEIQDDASPFYFGHDLLEDDGLEEHFLFDGLELGQNDEKPEVPMLFDDEWTENLEAQNKCERIDRDSVPSCTIRGYFADYNGDQPPPFQPFADMMQLRLTKYPRNLKLNRWSNKERMALARGIRQTNQRLLLDQTIRQVQRDSNGRDEQCATRIRSEMERIQNMSDDKLEMNLAGIDWKQISSFYVPSKSEMDCIIQWTVNDHPLINKSEWSQEELRRLEVIVKQQNYPPTWKEVAEELCTDRSAIDCFIQYQRRLNTNLIKSKWTREEDAVLRRAVKLYGEKNWVEVSKCLAGRTGQQCLHRWLKSLDPNIKRGKWTREEDERLMSAIQLHGNKWSAIQLLVPGRTDVQCRERWANVLDPNLVQSSWSSEEDQRLRALVERYGTGKWSWISSQMGTRTDNQCWRRWKSLHSKQKCKQPGEPIPVAKVSEPIPVLPLPKVCGRSGLSRRRLAITMAQLLVDQSPDEPIPRVFPYPPDTFNVSGMARLLDAMDPHKDNQPGPRVDTFEYRLLYARFECLFLWPMLLGLARMRN